MGTDITKDVNTVVDSIVKKALEILDAGIVSRKPKSKPVLSQHKQKYDEFMTKLRHDNGNKAVDILVRATYSTHKISRVAACRLEEIRASLKAKIESAGIDWQRLNIPGLLLIYNKG